MSSSMPPEREQSTQLHPRIHELIAEIPKTSVGKFDKKVLRSMFAAGDLDVTRTKAPGEK